MKNRTMKDKIKRFLLCFLAVSMFAVTGNGFADNEDMENADISEDSADASSFMAGAKETEEPVYSSYDDIVKYLKKIGSVDGMDIYFRDKSFENDIWEQNGGKPAKKADYTEAQTALADALAELKKLGELTAVDSDKREFAATFGDSSKTDGGKLWVSEGRRYLLMTDENGTSVKSIRRVISTVDDPTVFASLDGKTIDRTDRDYKKIIGTYTEGTAKDPSDEGKKVYRDISNDGFVWLDETGTQVLGAYRKCAENDDYIMLADDRLGNVGIKSRETGYIWWSAPEGVSRDKLATPAIIDDLRSSSVLRYGVPERRSVSNYLRSGTSDCELTVKDIKNGIRVTYTYKKAGFSYPVDYTLEKDYLKAAVKVAEISETNSANVATELTLMGSFGAASDSEEGYFVIPDGSGALVRFNNNRTMDTNAYTRRVYGNDVTAVPTSAGAVAEQIYLPVYGIVKGDNALLAVAAKGDSNADLSVKISKQSNSSYNLCAFSFLLRSSDIFYMSGGNKVGLTVFESGDIKSDDIEMRYYPISKTGADYTDIAAKYREYLTAEKGLTAKVNDDPSLYIGLYGGAQKKKPVMGVPVTMKQSVTDYGQAEEILRELKNQGASDLVVSYANWTDDGINKKVDTSASPSGTLGGSSGFKKLTGFMDENGYELYPLSENRNFYAGNGYSSFSSTCIRVSGSYSRIVSYDRAYGIPDGFKKNMSLLSPSYYGEISGEIAANFSKKGLTGADTGTLTTSLYGDYGKKNISRYKAMTMAEDALKTIADSLDKGIMAEGANAYALPYVRHIKNVPVTSSRYDIFDEDVPFYQSVIHGMIPYTSYPVNSSADPEEFKLRAASMGSLLSYDMIYEEASVLKDTELDVLYFANYLNWADEAAAAQNELKGLYRQIAHSTITGYTVSSDGRKTVTEYSNGTAITVDFEEMTISYTGKGGAG